MRATRSHVSMGSAGCLLDNADRGGDLAQVGRPRYLDRSSPAIVPLEQ